MTRQPFPKLLRPFVALLLGIAIIPVMVSPGFAEDVYKTMKQQAYSGSRDREYIVHLPSGYDPAGPPLPLVMVLHGCNENHETIKHDTNFDSVADQERFIVVYPFITSYDGTRSKNCWGFWMDQHIHRGKGEVEDLAEIIREVQRDYRVDKCRIHIAGISSGGGMTVDVMVAHPDLIASGSPTAGVPYAEGSGAVSFVCENPGNFKSINDVANAMTKEMGDQRWAVPIFIVHSTSDCMVKIKSAENIRDSWGKAFSIDTANPVASSSGNTKGTTWNYKKYGNLGGRTVVETLFVDGLPHGWYGDADGQYAFSNAPDTAQLAWQFFKSHPRPNCAVPGLPVVVIKNVTPDNASHSIRVDGTLDGPVSGITVKVELLGLSPQPAQAAEVDVATKSFVYLSNTGLPDNTYYRPLVTVTDSRGNMVKALGSPVALGAPIVPPPALTIEDAKCSQEHVSLVGTVRDDTGVTSVEVRFDGKNWLPAVVSAPNWSYDGSGLPEGTHAIDVRAMSKAALDTIKSTNCPVLTPYDAKQQSDLTGHVTSSRIRSYPNGFGSADKTYMELYQEHGLSQQFWLYRARNTKDWYDEIGNIPVAGAAKTPSTPSTSAPPQFPVRGFGSERRAVMPCCP